jgi:hypothetical protein
LTFARACGIIIPERGKENPNKPERMNTMEFYSMEQFEIMGDLMEDYQEWLDFEEDMKSNPWG